jgi:hypothetical protein
MQRAPCATINGSARALSLTSTHLALYGADLPEVLADLALWIEDLRIHNTYEKHRARYQDDEIDDDEDRNVENHLIKDPHKQPQLHQHE